MGGRGKYTLFLGGDREEVLLDVVVLDLADEGLSDDGGLVGESSSLDGGSVDVCGVVGEEFGVEVWGKGGVGDVGVLAEVGPWLEVLVVDVLSGLLQGFAGNGGHDLSGVGGADAKDSLEDGVERVLGGVTLVADVPGGSDRDVEGDVPDGAGDIADVDGVETEATIPEELHLLAEVLVDGTDDDAGSNSGTVTRTVDNGGTKDDKGETLDVAKGLLSLELVAGKTGPGVKLGGLLGGFLGRGLVDLGSGDLNEATSLEADGTLSNLDGEAEDLLVVNLISLAVLGLSSKVDDDVELGASLLESESAVDTGIGSEVALLVVDDGVGKGSSVGSTEEGGGGEDLVDDTNVRAEVALDEVGHEIAANEANSSKNENLWFSSHDDDAVVGCG